MQGVPPPPPHCPFLTPPPPQYKEGTSDLIEKRWAHFHGLVDQVRAYQAPS